MVKEHETQMIEVSKIKLDQTNPNVMEKDKFQALKRNIQRFGFIVPVIINKDYVIADGEHRFKAAIELGYDKVLTIIIDVDEVDRRIIRQVMNKLHGEHDIRKDIEDYQFMLEKKKDFDYIVSLLGESKKYLQDMMELKNELLEEYIVLKEEKIKDEIESSRQITIKLTDDQKREIVKKFGEWDKTLRIVDYFIIAK